MNRIRAFLTRNQSLKDVLTIHELAFIILIILMAISSGIGFNLWQSLTNETQRINKLVVEVQQTRGDIYRQIKELFDAFFLEDLNARAEFDQFTQSVEKHFTALDTLAEKAEEKAAVNALHNKYQELIHETSLLFQQQATLSRSTNKTQLYNALDNDLESGLFQHYELILNRTEALLEKQKQTLSHQLQTIKKTSTIILSIPILLAVLLLFFSRTYLKRAIVRPIKQVLITTSKISQGNLSVSATEEGVTEMVEVSHSIKKMAEELAVIQETLIVKEKEAAQGQLVPMLAHNIRNPLASIRATAQVLDDPDLDHDTREALQGIIQTVDRLERWTGALLAYLLPLTPQMQRVKLFDVIVGACTPVQQKATQKQIKVLIPVADKQDEVMTDAHLLEQVIYNFVANAIDASPIHSSVEIKLTDMLQNYLLQIIDQGPGLPFTPDAKVKNAPTTKQYGTGLGIPFGFKVCEALGYALSFDQRQPHGTCITIKIPKP